MNKKDMALALAKERTLLTDKLKAIVDSKDLAGEFVWATMSRSLLYSINNLLSIADNVVDADNALKWGLVGILDLEILDAIGVEYFISRLKKEGKSIPSWLDKMFTSGFSSIYSFLDGEKVYYCPKSEKYVAHKFHSKEMTFNLLKKITILLVSIGLLSS